MPCPERMPKEFFNKFLVEVVDIFVHFAMPPAMESLDQFKAIPAVEKVRRQIKRVGSQVHVFSASLGRECQECVQESIPQPDSHYTRVDGYRGEFARRTGRGGECGLDNEIYSADRVRHKSRRLKQT